MLSIFKKYIARSSGNYKYKKKVRAVKRLLRKSCHKHIAKKLIQDFGSFRISLIVLSITRINTLPIVR